MAQKKSSNCVATTHWTQFGFDAQNTRFNPNETILSTSNVANLLKAWSFATGHSAISSPAVVDGIVYTSTYDSVNPNNSVYALHAGSGTPLWTSAPSGSGATEYFSPAVANGVVYVGSSDDNLYALDASTGAKLWNFATGGFVETAPNVVNGVVYIGSEDHNVYALDANTGAQL